MSKKFKKSNQLDEIISDECVKNNAALRNKLSDLESQMTKFIELFKKEKK